MANLQALYELVESCIKRLGVEPESTRGNQEGQWTLVKGSVKVYLDLWHIERENRPYFQVLAPVMQVPTTNQQAFFEELLSINHTLYGVAFTVNKGWAWIKIIRETVGMDEDEAFAMITRVGNYADQYDDLLKEKYTAGGGRPPASA